MKSKRKMSIWFERALEASKPRQIRPKGHPQNVQLHLNAAHMTWIVARFERVKRA